MNSSEIRRMDVLDLKVPVSKRGRFWFGLLVVFITVGVVGVVALAKTLVQNDTHRIESQQTEVEQEMVQLRAQMRSLEIKIEEVLTRKHLTGWLSENGSMLKTILLENIVTIEASPEEF